MHQIMQGLGRRKLAVTGEHLAVIRGMLWGANDDEMGGRLATVQQEGAESERVLELLLKVAFVRATRRRFGSETTHADLIRYVAKARTTGFLQDETVDIRIVERLLRGALGDDEAMQGMTAEDTLVLGPLMGDLVHNELDLDEAGVDELLDQAREETERLATELPS